MFARMRAIRGLPKLVTRVKTRGWGEVGHLLKDRVREEIDSGDTLLFLVRSTQHDGLDIEGLTHRWAHPEDADRYARDIGTDSPSTFRSRLTRGTRCFLVESEGRFVHASWVTTEGSWAREIRAYLVPPPNDAYIYESFTRADARGRGIYPYALANILKSLHEEGIERAWIAVEEDNAASRRSIDKAGFTFAFAITYRRRWGRLRLEPPTGPDAAVGRSFIRHKSREK
ncbi:MAG: hypothetical protein QOH26_570 [Actinomycetota bacterium]|jgi:ribosomal protein S18 acetylase RimI-like enzyme|nr:hypothetical protein [Actinomycetota bacterium]